MRVPSIRTGNIHVLSLADMGFTYRHCGVPEDWIFTEATSTRGRPASRPRSCNEMDEVADYREKNQPIKERTGGSTFKNPPGHSAWKLVDEAGCRGLRVGGAKVSDMHCNFLINDRQATGEDVETLGRDGAGARQGAVGHHARLGDHPLGVPNARLPIGEALAAKAPMLDADQS